MKQILKLIVAIMLVVVFPAIQVKADSKEEITLTATSDGATKDDALKNALRTAIEQAYGAFVSANTTILNDELVKDEIVTVSNGSIKDYKEISSFEKPDGSGYMMTVNATVSLPHLITYAKNHGSECEFAGNTFGMELRLFNLQKENELKALYNSIPEIENLAKTTMHWELQVDEPKVIDYQLKLKIDKSTEYKKGGGWSGKLPYGYEQAFGELITSDASFGRGDDTFYFQTDIDKLLNKPVKRPDGLPSVEQDKEILDILNEMQNGQCALVRFKLSWLPNEGSNELSNYIESLFNSLSIDRETAEKYKNQGHDLCNSYMLRWDHPWGLSSNYNFRNSPKDIALWTDSVRTVINKVKNSFEIIDNTGQISSFNPLELSQWIYQQQPDEYLKSYEYLSPEQRKLLWDSRSEIEYQMYHPGAGDTQEWGSYAKTCRLPNSSQKITTFTQRRHGSQAYDRRRLITINGKGLFHNVSCLNYYGSLLEPLDKYYNSFGREVTKTTWIAYILIPLSEISKYSSFKVVPKEQ